MYFYRPDLLEKIPQAKTNGGWVMTDTCNAARNYHRLVVESIKLIAEEEGVPDEQIKVFEAGKVINNFIVSSTQF